MIQIDDLFIFLCGTKYNIIYLFIKNVMTFEIFKKIIFQQFSENVTKVGFDFTLRDASILIILAAKTEEEAMGSIVLCLKDWRCVTPYNGLDNMG